jgi:hypothetical protein
MYILSENSIVLGWSFLNISNIFYVIIIIFIKASRNREQGEKRKESSKRVGEE